MLRSVSILAFLVVVDPRTNASTTSSVTDPFSAKLTLQSNQSILLDLGTTLGRLMLWSPILNVVVANGKGVTPSRISFVIATAQLAPNETAG